MSELKKLQFDVDQLRSAADSIEDISAKLEEGKTNLQNQLNTLQEEWVSEAAAKFFGTYNSDWVAQIDDYVTMLDQLAAALDGAADEYEPLVDEFNKISLEV